MKKTISINIGGNIFHIEEEGYEKLKSYLDSVHSYFSTFEDSKEIIDDIENRIAEKFYTQLKKNKEAISSKEVDQLIQSMGTVADFEATFEGEVVEEKVDDKVEEKIVEPTPEEKEKQSEKRRLYRDSKNNTLGGVASGMAYYFGVDPLWIRLLWILFVLVSGGVGVVVYIVFWVVLPEKELEEKESVKKFFRDPDRRVLGGVASGIASFFAIDPVVIRILFIVFVFIGGSGFILYLILWIITPEAKSVTEKMEMKGEPVTMAGIEKNVKKSLKIEEGEENIFVKVLLFPFRLIAMIFDGLGKAMGPLLTFIAEAFRIFFGVIILVVGFSTMISLIFALLFMLGLDLQWGDNIGTIDGIPLMDFVAPLSPIASASAFFLVFIPALGIALLGLTILMKRAVGNVYVTITMVVIWFAALMGAFLTFPRIVGQFSSDDSYEEEVTFKAPKDMPILKLNDLGWDRFDYQGVELRLRGHADEKFVAVINKEAWGSSRKVARENAEMIGYEVSQSGNDFEFDSRVTFSEDARFRFQNVDVTFYIPYGVEFQMDQDLDEILRNTLHLNGYQGYQMGENTWMFDEEGIQCMTCGFGSGEYDYETDGNTRTFGFQDFDEIRVSNSFRVQVFKSDEYNVELRGKRADLDGVMIQQSGDRISISHEEEDDWNNNSDDITVSIYMPDLTYFRASGGCRGDIENFERGNLELDLSGNTDFDLDIDIDELDIDLNGEAKLEVFGDAKMLNVELSGRGYLNSFNLDAENVTISSSGNSTAKVFADDAITVSSSGQSRVTYRGTSNVTISESESSRVRKD